MCATLTTIGSGSQGNAYCLEVNGEKLLLECGVRRLGLLRALNYDLKDISACISTHIHMDHINPQTLKYLLSCGINVYAPQSVCEKYPNCKQVEHLHKYRIDGFTILPLRVPHGDCECVSFFITLPDGQTLLFCTDAETLPYRLPNINTLMIEANFSEELIIDRLCEGQDIRSHYNTHMELNETIKVIKRLNNPNLNKVILIHLSSGNSDEQMFKNRIFSETGVRCDIAHSSDVYELKICEF